MGRQQQQRSSGSGGDLLNFHFSGPPPQQQQQPQQQHNNNNNNRRRNHRNNHNHNKHQYQLHSHMFHLHSSADHAFVITRYGLKQQLHSFSGSDEAVSWELVRMVKYLVPSEPDATCCPICLDTLVSARITKCGHHFCLPCVLRHVQVHAQSNPYTHVKCPCCSMPLHVPDLRPVLLTTSLPPRLHQRMKLVKLHRTKECPSPYLPRPEASKRSSSYAAPCMTDDDAPFCRFNYIDPATYQAHLATNKVELEMELANHTKQQPQHRSQHKFSQQQYQSDVEAIFVSSSLDVVRKEIAKSMEELNEEQSLAETSASVGSGVCQHQPDQFVARNYPFTHLPPPSAELDDTTSDNRHGGASVGSASEGGDSAVPRYRGDSVGSYASVENPFVADEVGPPDSPASPQKKHKKRNKHKEFPKASMYLDSEGSTHFYQCEDGQLCFLSRFNMSCLLSDFSSKVPDLDELSDTSTLNYWQRRKLLPLLDIVEGEILEIESIHLTPDMRKRMPFLAHLPLYADIHFVELDLNSLLSIETKRKFKADFDKRRKCRQSKAKAEKREDKMAQRKEEERINQLKARMQQIDPNDAFFQVSLPEEPLELTGDAFGPAISGGRNSSSTGAAPTAVAAANGYSQPAVSFSNVCQSGGAFPVLATSPETNFPALGSSPPSKSNQSASTWGIPAKQQSTSSSWGQPKAPDPTWGSPSRSNPAPSVTAGAAAGVSLQLPGPKKRGKGKKIVLFSTGGQRGTSY